mmetsp:Transcript_15323/g.34247  ORF Transcript_15323/g.34247 Transcript_15323/m.34247 type:complete len:206 (-) Transcript_15323:462-1079(-)
MGPRSWRQRAMTRCMQPSQVPAKRRLSSRPKTSACGVRLLLCAFAPLSSARPLSGLNGGPMISYGSCGVPLHRCARSTRPQGSTCRRTRLRRSASCDPSSKTRTRLGGSKQITFANMSNGGSNSKPPRAKSRRSSSSPRPRVAAAPPPQPRQARSLMPGGQEHHHWHPRRGPSLRPPTAPPPRSARAARTPRRLHRVKLHSPDPS